MKHKFKEELYKARCALNKPIRESNEYFLETVATAIPTVRTSGLWSFPDIIRLAFMPDIDGSNRLYYRKDGQPLVLALDKANRQVVVNINTPGPYQGTWKLTKEQFEGAIIDYLIGAKSTRYKEI